MAADIAQVLTRQQIADQMLTWQQTAELLNMRPQTLAVWAMPVWAVPASVPANPAAVAFRVSWLATPVEAFSVVAGSPRGNCNGVTLD